MTQRVGLIPVIIDFLLAVKYSGCADIQKWNLQFICDIGRIFNCNSVCEVGIVWMKLTKLQISIGSQVKETVRLELGYILAVRIDVSEVQVCQPLFINIDIRAFQD